MVTLHRTVTAGWLWKTGGGRREAVGKKKRAEFFSLPGKGALSHFVAVLFRVMAMSLSPGRSLGPRRGSEL